MVESVAGFGKCQFCGYLMTIRGCKTHENFCKNNPNAKKRKVRNYNIDKKLYDFTLDFIKENKPFNSKILARAKYPNARSITGNETYRFAKIITVLKNKNIIENYSPSLYRKKR